MKTLARLTGRPLSVATTRPAIRPAGGGGLSQATRFRLAQKAFAHTSAYDGAIANWLTARGPDGESQGFPLSMRYAGELVQTLIGENLIDEYRLMVYPLVLDKGKRLFRSDLDLSQLELVDSKATKKGVLLTRYKPV